MIYFYSLFISLNIFLIIGNDKSWKDFYSACDDKALTIVLCEKEIKEKRFGGYINVS